MFGGHRFDGIKAGVVCYDAFERVSDFPQVLRQHSWYGMVGNNTWIFIGNLVLLSAVKKNQIRLDCVSAKKITTAADGRQSRNGV